MRVEPFCWRHAGELAPRAINLLGMAAPTGEFIRRQAALGPWFSLIDDQERVAAIGGVCLAGQGMGEAWVSASGWADSHALAYARAVKTSLEDIMDQQGLHRVSALVSAAKGPDGRRLRGFVRLLGFRPEGLLRALGPERLDLMLWAKVRPR